MHIIPRTTKVRSEIIKGITASDLIFIAICAVGAIGLFASNFAYHEYFGFAWLGFTLVFYFVKTGDETRLYQTLVYLFRFFAQSKFYTKEAKRGALPMNKIIPFTGLYQDRFIDFGEYYAQVIEVSPIVFGLLNQERQDLVINSLQKAITRINNDQTASIIKINKAMILDNYIYNEDKKYNKLMDMQGEGEMSQSEVEVRAGVFEERVSMMERMNRQEKIYKDYFYIVVYDKDRETLETTINGIISTLQNAVTAINCKLVRGNELLVFMRANFGKEFDERELETISMNKYFDWVTPNEIKFQAARTFIDGKPYRHFAITDFPIQVGNAWAAPFYLLDRTKVITKFKPVPRYESEKAIDKAIMEMESKMMRGGSSSKQIENQTHLQTLQALLVQLKNNNQQLFETSVYITCEEPARKDVRAILKQEGFKFSEMFGRQVDAFVSSNISMRNACKEAKRGIPTDSIAAMFPFISSALQDENGFYIGDNEFPVFLDFFKRDRERVNSNMMVIGKSGSGKSYGTKTLLSNFAADNSKIFILDPENEYTNLALNLNGKVIDVGSSAMGIINPFHVFTSLKDESLLSQIKKRGRSSEEIEQAKYNAAQEGVEYIEEDEEIDTSDTFAQHLQFLEQFFRVILEGMSSDAFEELNSLVVEIYRQKGINDHSDFANMKAEEFPIFDDLYELILHKIKTETNEYIKTNLMVIETYIKKFAKGGRNSKLWNGPTTLETKENFVSFNFQSLLANNNQIIANAQMLIIFKYLMNEIIKNKDFNQKYKLNRHIIVAVDEAHMYINPEYPIALDFMAQMAKRIRKYGGMQIVITQNIKDFVGSPEIARQSTAVINACQYSFIFSLAPSDLNDLVELYRRSGEINKEEQNSIITAGVGQAFVITSPMNRTTVQITAGDYVKKIFS
ncbi:MAG: DUF87 domain-containing protein [Clostridiales bacterium]|nr:DUF87 domain-containing protein [Clostridiales bacterium]